MIIEPKPQPQHPPARNLAGLAFLGIAQFMIHRPGMHGKDLLTIHPDLVVFNDPLRKRLFGE